MTSAATLLTPRRLRAQAIVLALCLWGICAVDFATPGLFDRAGNIKFQDFLQFYISARLIRDGRNSQLYDQRVADHEMETIVGPQDRVRLPTVYGPQVGLAFVPLTRFSFSAAARLWVALSLLIAFACIYLVWKSCPALQRHPAMVLLCAIAFPPLFHFFVRGQISALILACFTAAFLAFRAERNWLAGIALGFLVLKPPFLVAIPLVLLLSQSWQPLFGLAASALAQLAVATIYFGTTLMRTYIETMLHMSRWIGLAEAGPAYIQMHSLRSFWTLLFSGQTFPWPQFALALYLLTSIAAIAIAASVWKSSSPLPLRFSALTLAAVLVNPHLFVYDLLVLAPVLLILVDWTLTTPPTCNRQTTPTPTLQLLLYLSFILPLFGPVSRWTHLQLSVPVFAALLWMLWRLSTTHKLASHESAVV